MKKKICLAVLLLIVLFFSFRAVRRTIQSYFFSEGERFTVRANYSPHQENLHEFINLRIRNSTDETFYMFVNGLEHRRGGAWMSIEPSLSADAGNWLLQFFDLEPSSDSTGAPGIQSLWTPLPTSRDFSFIFEDFLSPDQPIQGRFRISVRIYDLDKNYLETLYSEEFNIRHFSFED